MQSTEANFMNEWLEFHLLRLCECIASHMANDSHWCKPLAFDGTRPSELAELERLEEEVQAVS